MRKIAKLGTIAVAVVAVSFLMSAGSALASTDFHSEWQGSGEVSADFNAGDDAVVSFETGGSYIEGEFDATDKQNNPYSYAVDDVKGSIRAEVEGGGLIEYEHERTDSEDYYGHSGQSTWTKVESTDEAGVAFRSRTNYASMKNSNWGFQTNNHFEAEGESFSIEHALGTPEDDPDDPILWNDGEYEGDWNGAYLNTVGSGEASVTMMGQKANNDHFNFGDGTGCFRNVGVDAEGGGQTNLYSHGTDYLAGDDFEMSSGGSYSQEWNYDDGVSIEGGELWKKGH